MKIGAAAVPGAHRGARGPGPARSASTPRARSARCGRRGRSSPLTRRSRGRTSAATSRPGRSARSATPARSRRSWRARRPDAETRKFATRSLIKFGPEASDALLAALADPRRRRCAATRAGARRRSRSGAASSRCSRSRGRSTRDVLLWAFGRLGDLRGFSRWTRARGADPTGRCGSPRCRRSATSPTRAAVPALKAALDDPEWIVREWAARGLESVTGERFTYRDQHGSGRPLQPLPLRARQRRPTRAPGGRRARLWRAAAPSRRSSRRRRSRVLLAMIAAGWGRTGLPAAASRCRCSTRTSPRSASGRSG